MRITWLLIIVLITNHSFAQEAATRVATGTVVDEFGRGIEGVLVQAKSSADSTRSDESGSFEITVRSGESITFSHPHYQYRETERSSAAEIVVQLRKNYLQYPEDVDVLYESRKADKILGSVASVYTSQLTSTPAPLYAYALAGRIPGLYSEQTRGWTTMNASSLALPDGGFGTSANPSTQGLKGPSDNGEISLRLRGQAPITIVDGIQRELYTIDPENIESVSVLKDALSTALLGQRSSRGVVLVTTKKIQKGEPRLSFTGQTGFQTPLGLPKPLSAYQYAYLYNEALSNEESPLAYTYGDFQAYRTQSSPYTHPDVNWFETILKPSAPISRYSLNIAGGGNAARYSVGLGYLGQNGLFRSDNPDYETNALIRRYTINTNVDVDVTKEFTARLQMYARIQDNNQPGGTVDGVMSHLYITPNNAYPVFNPDGSLGGSQSYPNNIYGVLNRSGYIEDYNRDISTNLDLNYRFDKWVKGLWAKVQSNISVYGSNITDRSAGVPSFKLAISPTGDSTYSRYGALADQRNDFRLTYSAQYWYIQGATGYNRTFGKHTFGSKLFYDRHQVILNYDLPEANQNIAANVSYDFDSKYFIEGTVNYSGNDRFPPDKQFGLFYAGGLGWNVARENFIRNSSLSWIDRLKLRATFGRTGNVNMGYFAWRASYTSNTSLYAYSISRALQFGFEQSVLANPNASWEKADKLNAGLDFGAFDGKLQFTVDYYNDRYFDLMQGRGKQPSIIGITYPMENIGVNRYKGWEFSLTHQNRAGEFQYFVQANASLERSRVEFMDEVKRQNEWNKRTGQPVGMMFGYIVDGFIRDQQEAETAPSIAGYALQPGDLRYRDLNGDGTINEFDEAPIGTTKPLVYYGATLGFSYKGIDFSVLLQGVSNRELFFPDSLFYSFGRNGIAQGYEHIVGRWTPETGDASTYPRLSPGINGNNDPVFGTRYSSFWRQSGNYFRLKNIEIGYTLPHELTRKWKIPSVRIFVNGLNLLTFSNLGDTDPEVFRYTYPIQRVTNFGINVKF